MTSNGKNPATIRKQTKVIAALLSESTQEQAAKKAGVGSRTLARWLAKDHEFRSRLATAEQDAVGAAARRIAHGAEVAVSHLIDIVLDDLAEPAERRLAANSILTHLPKTRLLGSIEAAIAELVRTS